MMKILFMFQGYKHFTRSCFSRIYMYLIRYCKVEIDIYVYSMSVPCIAYIIENKKKIMEFQKSGRLVWRNIEHSNDSSFISVWMACINNGAFFLLDATFDENKSFIYCANWGRILSQVAFGFLLVTTYGTTWHCTVFKADSRVVKLTPLGPRGRQMDSNW